MTLVGAGEEAISFDEYRASQPFGQVPAIEDGELRLFESDAIVLHVVERRAALRPRDPAERACVVQWSFAALDTIEPPIQKRAAIDLFRVADQPALADYLQRCEARPAFRKALADRMALFVA